jgi:hypothetical protein
MAARRPTTFDTYTASEATTGELEVTIGRRTAFHRDRAATKETP